MPEIRTNNEYKYTQSSRMYFLASGFFWKRLNAYWRLEILVMRRIFYFLVHKKLVNVFFLSFNVFVKCKKTLYLRKSLFKTYLKSIRTKSLSFCCLSLWIHILLCLCEDQHLGGLVGANLFQESGEFGSRVLHFHCVDNLDKLLF